MKDPGLTAAASERGLGRTFWQGWLWLRMSTALTLAALVGLGGWHRLRLGSWDAVVAYTRGDTVFAMADVVEVEPERLNYATPIMVSFTLQNLTGEPVTVLGGEFICGWSPEVDLPLTLAPNATAPVRLEVWRCPTDDPAKPFVKSSVLYLDPAGKPVRLTVTAPARSRREGDSHTPRIGRSFRPAGASGPRPPEALCVELSSDS